jgi:hypothetical protein
MSPSSGVGPAPVTYQASSSLLGLAGLIYATGLRFERHVALYALPQPHLVAGFQYGKPV